MRKLLVSLVVLVALLAAADVGLRLWSESVVATRIDEALSLPRRPDVGLHGFPFSLQVLRSHFDRVELELEGVEAQGLLLRTVRLELTDVRFPRRRLFSPGTGTVRARSGTGSLELTDEDLTASLQQRDVPLEVEFVGPEVRASTTLEVAGLEVEASATATLEVAGDVLVFRPEDVEVAEAVTVPADALAFEVPLPQPLEGITFDRVVVEEGVVRVEGDIDHLSFRLRP